MNLKILGLIGAVFIIGTIAIVLLRNSEQVDVAVISNFQECAAAGYPIMESYPEQCATPDGRTFINESQMPPSDSPGATGGGNSAGIEPIAANGCVVAGCSMQLCVAEGEAANIVSTCEYRAEYACYKEASCEPQANGTCGWTETPSLKACLQNPPPLDSSAERIY